MSVFAEDQSRLRKGHGARNMAVVRHEFYASFNLPHRIDKLQPIVDAFAYRFNHHRPHQALGDLTPAAYLATISSVRPASHMA